VERSAQGMLREDGSPAIESFKGGALKPLDPPLHPGMRVFIHGLTSDVVLNGQTCEILGFDEPTARWQVQLNNGTGKLLERSKLLSALSVGMTQVLFPKARRSVFLVSRVARKSMECWELLSTST